MVSLIRLSYDSKSPALISTRIWKLCECEHEYSNLLAPSWITTLIPIPDLDRLNPDRSLTIHRKSGGSLFDWPEAWPWSPSCGGGPAAAPAWSPARGGAPPAARVADQDPYPDPDSESGSRRAKMTHKSGIFFLKFMFWSLGWPLLRAEGFFCNLDVLYGGLGIAKL